MSVPVWNRTESNVEFLHNFHKLRKEVNVLMMRDFGIKPRTYDISLVKDIYEMCDEDKSALNDISSKYGIWGNTKSMKRTEELYSKLLEERKANV